MERRKALGSILSATALLATAGKVTSAETKTGTSAKPKYTPWVGDLDRSKIKWGPTVDLESCIGCGMCMHCGPKVYDWADGKPKVARFNSCMVGCETCKNVCPSDAISFPKFSSVKNYMMKEKLYDRIKDILKEQGKIPQDG